MSDAPTETSADVVALEELRVAARSVHGELVRAAGKRDAADAGDAADATLAELSELQAGLESDIRTAPNGPYLATNVERLRD